MIEIVSRGGGAHPASPPPPGKIGKNMIFWRKIVIFHTKYPKNFRASSAIGKNMIFWRKIVIFHTKYPKNVPASLRSAQLFLSAPPLPSLEILDPPLVSFVT
jgi:hypothetical protein